MIHDLDTSTLNNINIYDELRRARDNLCRHDNKGLHGFTPCPSEFVNQNIYGRTYKYIRYVYYAVYVYIRIRTTSIPKIDYAYTH